MSKLYLFGIGGTGARVVKSLTMLLSAGVKCKADTIVPIFIDPDEGAGNLTETITMLQRYGRIHKQVIPDSGSDTAFFRTDIRESVRNFILPLKEVSDKKFSEYMSFNTLNDSNKAMLSMLFSEKNLDSSMEVGFKGNPNIGSVVLNQFTESEEFINFANDFAQGDQIFIISSIFGGTGASGFPLLLKTLRSNNQIPNFALINNANVGAITVMPYFGVVQDQDSSIDSATFVSKTKAALSYYERNISNTNSIDYLYYIGDTVRSNYDNCEGGKNQKNAAHMVEMLSALAILDFAGSSKASQTIHKEFGICDVKDDAKVIFGDFATNTKALIQKPMSQFLLFSKYMNEHFNPKGDKVWQIDKKNGFDKNFWDSDFVGDVRAMQEAYDQWLREMAANNRAFAPFELQPLKHNLFGFVNGVTPSKMRGIRYFNKSNYDLFDAVLDEKTKENDPRQTTRERQLVDLFYEATDDLTTNKLNF